MIYEPRPGSVTLGGWVVAQVGVATADGAQTIEDVWCIGVTTGDDLACDDDPRIRIVGGVDHDIPCGPDGTPDECATLPPTPDPAARAAAHPLRVPSLVVPLDHVGDYEVRVGTATLPNGYLSKRSAELVDSRPTMYWIRGGVRIDVRPALRGRPPVGSVYRDPYPGPERVRAFLVFTVTETSPGAVLRVRNIVVG